MCSGTETQAAVAAVLGDVIYPLSGRVCSRRTWKHYRTVNCFTALTLAISSICATKHLNFSTKKKTAFHFPVQFDLLNTVAALLKCAF